MAKKPYEDRTDPEKIQSQWHKLSGLHTREEWSAAIVRAATAAEIAANHAIRCEFDQQSQLSAHFVDSALRWANGLAGKMDRLLLPMTMSSKKKHAKVKELRKIALVINERRNAIAHQGEFCNEGEAKEIIAAAQRFITGLVTLYDAAFVLKKRKNAAA
ncbi:MAG: hypothetical protein AB7I35_14350 [Ramlibacter sp.]